MTTGNMSTGVFVFPGRVKELQIIALFRLGVRSNRNKYWDKFVKKIILDPHLTDQVNLSKVGSKL